MTSVTCFGLIFIFIYLFTWQKRFSVINTGIFSTENVFRLPQKPLLQKKNRKAPALLCLTSGLRPNAANSSDLYFDSIRCYASYAPGTRVTDAINTSVFPGKMSSDRRK